MVIGFGILFFWPPLLSSAILEDSLCCLLLLRSLVAIASCGVGGVCSVLVVRVGVAITTGSGSDIFLSNSMDPVGV